MRTANIAREREVSPATCYFGVCMCVCFILYFDKAASPDLVPLGQHDTKLRMQPTVPVWPEAASLPALGVHASRSGLRPTADPALLCIHVDLECCDAWCRARCRSRPVYKALGAARGLNVPSVCSFPLLVITVY